MKLRWVIVYVPELEATMSFYERAFGLKRRFVSADGGYGEMESGETRIGFATERMADEAIDGGVVPLDPDDRPQATELGFATDDVRAAFRTAKGAGATVVSEPAVKPWGQTVAFVRDINGVLIEIGTDLP